MSEFFVDLVTQGSAVILGVLLGCTPFYFHSYIKDELRKEI